MTTSSIPGRAQVSSGDTLAKRVGLVCCLMGMIVSQFAHAKPDALIQTLSEVTKARAHRYNALDDRGQTLGTLKVFQVKPGEYLGVYHAVKNGVFSIHLGRSEDLLNWKHLVELDDHAAQPTVWVEKEGPILLAYEKDAPNEVWMRVRHYADLSQLILGRCTDEVDLPRTLAPTAEGTPSFESVRLEKGPKRSEIALRFHYYRDGDVDRAAIGTLTNFREWRTRPDPILNETLEARNFGQYRRPGPL